MAGWISDAPSWLVVAVVVWTLSTAGVAALALAAFRGDRRIVVQDPHEAAGLALVREHSLAG